MVLRYRALFHIFKIVVLLSFHRGDLKKIIYHSDIGNNAIYNECGLEFRIRYENDTNSLAMKGTDQFEVIKRAVNIFKKRKMYAKGIGCIPNVLMKKKPPNILTSKGKRLDKLRNTS